MDPVLAFTNLLSASEQTGVAYLAAKSKLLHEVLVVPEQPFVVHGLAFPAANSSHSDSETFTRGLDDCTVG